MPNSNEASGPEVKSKELLNNTIRTLLIDVRNALPVNAQGAIQQNSSGTSIVAGRELLRITQNEVLFAGKTNVERKILAEKSINNNVNRAGFIRFLEATDGSLIRLNHVGLSYFTPDMQRESVEIQEMIKTAGWKVYAEEAEESDQVWLFAGDVGRWEEPMVEFVLTEGSGDADDVWRPHFQIDMDFTLPSAILEHKALEAFGKDFVKWKLSVPGSGVVLLMGSIGTINGTKIQLGLGTGTRDTQLLRKNIIKEL